MWCVRYMWHAERTGFLEKGQKDNPVILTPANHGFQWELDCFASVSLNPPTPLVPWYHGKCSSQESLGCSSQGKGGSAAGNVGDKAKPLSNFCVKVWSHEAHLTYGLSILTPFFSIFIFLFCCKRNQKLGKQQNSKNLSQAAWLWYSGWNTSDTKKERGFCCSD